MSGEFDLPDDFLEHLERKGKKALSLKELVEEYKTWRRRA